MAARSESISDCSEINEEIEVLKHIYIDELDVEYDDSGEVKTIRLILHPSTCEDTSVQYVCLTLVCDIPPTYPYDVPTITIRNPRGLAEEEVQSIHNDVMQLAEDKKGEAMLFELIELAKESLTEGNIPRCECCICLEHFHEGDVFTKTNCYHYFHQHCLGRYIKHVLSKQTDKRKENNEVCCPVCRTPIDYNLQELCDAPPPIEDNPTFEISESTRQVVGKMKDLYIKQQVNGGIIDLDFEKNKFLINEDTVLDFQNIEETTNQDAMDGAKTDSDTKQKPMPYSKDKRFYDSRSRHPQEKPHSYRDKYYRHDKNAKQSYRDKFYRDNRNERQSFRDDEIEKKRDRDMHYRDDRNERQSYWNEKKSYRDKFYMDDRNDRQSHRDDRTDGKSYRDGYYGKQRFKDKYYRFDRNAQESYRDHDEKSAKPSLHKVTGKESLRDNARSRDFNGGADNSRPSHSNSEKASQRDTILEGKKPLEKSGGNLTKTSNEGCEGSRSYSARGRGCGRRGNYGRGQGHNRNGPDKGPMRNSDGNNSNSVETNRDHSGHGRGPGRERGIGQSSNSDKPLLTCDSFRPTSVKNENSQKSFNYNDNIINDLTSAKRPPPGFKQIENISVESKVKPPPGFHS